MTTLVISNRKMDYIMKMNKSLEKFGLLAKQSKMKQNNKRWISWHVARYVRGQFNRKYNNRYFIDNICGLDLADMQLMSNFNKRMRFLLCATDVFSKYALAVPLKDKKGITVTNNFQKIFDESDHKPNKIWLIKVLNFTIDQ